MDRRTALGLAALAGPAVWAVTGCAGDRPTDGRGSDRAAAPVGAGRLEFDVRDAGGRVLTWEEFRARQSNGAGDDGASDLLVDATTLQVVTPWPLEEGAGTFALDRPAGDVSLALAWPTADGYHQLLLDLPAPGRHEFSETAAEQAAAELERHVAGRDGYVPSAPVQEVRSRAALLLRRCRAETDPARRGGLAVEAFEAFTRAQLLVQEESGRRRAAAGSPVLGVTFDDPSRHDALPAVRALDPGGDVQVRLVFDAAEGPHGYRADVEAARAAGVAVVGQFLDSSQSAGVGEREWRQRVADYVRVLPGVTTWEVGNEVNGAWAGPAAAARTRWAARYVKENSAARTLVTLYWQMGEGEPDEQVFTWAAANLPDAADIDDVGLSVYPEEHPLGVSLDRVLRTLRRAYPDQRLLITELGYGAEDLRPIWWWGAPDDTAAGRLQVARFYSAAVNGLGDGGTFWWYFLQEALPPSPLHDALRRPGAGTGVAPAAWRVPRRTRRLRDDVRTGPQA
ncbi:hypothetical protein AB2L27_08265 [Kineococcus sp. LSe6-4]|uniref:Uncharacterized protein n=1 Tax=Kineococcus halophytocola TaxID=3234027 RepID=A0ABV4GZL3_9ACTN